MNLTSPQLLVGCLTRRRPEELHRLLRSLADASLDLDVVRAKLVVVESEGQVAWPVFKTMRPMLLERFMSVTYVASSRIGIAPNRNRVLEQAYEGVFDFFTMVDDDTTVHPEWFQTAVKLLDEHPTAWCVSGVTDVSIFGIEASAHHHAERESAHFTTALPATNNFVARAAPFRSVGLKFDERLPFAGGSDTRFFAAAVRHGGELLKYHQTTIVEHNSPRDYRPVNLFRRAFGRGASAGAWMRLDYPKLRSRAFVVLRRMLTASVLSLRRTLRGRRDAPRFAIAIEGIMYLIGLVFGSMTGKASMYRSERRT